MPATSDLSVHRDSSRSLTSNSEFVDDLYYAMPQRGGDMAGWNFWVGQLTAGVTRDQLRQQFLTSPEMTAQSAAIGAQGCLP